MKRIKGKVTKDRINKNGFLDDYVEVKESDFYPPKDNRTYQCSFSNRQDYLLYKEIYDEYVSDYN